jgi:hypothetical protein
MSPLDQSALSHLQAQLVGWEQIRIGLEHAQVFASNGFPDARVEVIELGECKATLRTVRDLEEYLNSKLRRELLASVGNRTLTLKEAEARIMMAQSTVANEDVIGRIVLK